MAARKGSTTEADVKVTFAEGTCRSGDGRETKPGRTYAQGGDAKLHSLLAKALRDGKTTVQFNDEPVVTIEAEYATHGWVIPAPKPKKEKAAKEKVEKAIVDEPVEDDPTAESQVA
jgi:hypothetical protein